MDFDDTPEEAAYRAEVRAWLDAHAPLRATSQAAAIGTGQAGSGTGGRGGRAARGHVADDEAQAAHVKSCRRWQRTLYDNGWAGITWPKEFGGRGGTAMQQIIFGQEQARYEVSSGALSVGLGMVGPTLMTWGTPEQRDRFIEPMLRGDEMWCQLFSEPGAGSDLPSLITRAEGDGDVYVVNGQKVWTTMAQYSDWAILLARTDLRTPGRQGISYLLVDMRSPGMDVRPLRQMTGVAHFNEVFLTDVRIPVENLVGAEGQGWQVARTTLASERMLIGGGSGTSFDDVAALARATGGVGDAVLRQRVAEAYVGYELLRFLGLRVQTAISQGRAPGAEASLLKLAMSRQSARLGDLGLALLGPAGLAAPTGTGSDTGTEMEMESGMGSGISRSDQAALTGFWQDRFLGQWSTRIGGGTDEIQRNQIAERVLGLPREPV
jgi:alkylation response protein AidB-like acyl-CoA dehydrogenase